VSNILEFLAALLLRPLSDILYTAQFTFLNSMIEIKYLKDALIRKKSKTQHLIIITYFT